MTNYITLTCPSCGAKLEVTEDIGQFACAHCGQEHILYQAGGIVALKPLVDGMRNIEEAVDDASLDLAINRLYFEIEELKEKKNIILTQNSFPENRAYLKVSSIAIPLLVILCCVLCKELPPGIMIIAFEVMGILLFFVAMFEVEKHEKQKAEWNAVIGYEIKEIDRLIKMKRAEMQQLKRNKE